MNPLTAIIAFFTFCAEFMKAVVIVLPLVVDWIKANKAEKEAALKRLKDAEAKEELDKSTAVQRQMDKEARNIAASKIRYDSLWRMKHDTIVQYLKDKQQDSVLLLALDGDVALVDAVLDDASIIDDEYRATEIVNILRKGA